MKKKFLKALQYILFLAIGIFLFWLVYKDLEFDKLKSELRHINYWWIGLSFVLGILSHISRAVRWNMLIRPLGYKPRIINSFLGVMVMYLTNLALPRAGELARCSVLTKYEKIPFTKLVGTVVVERATDVIALMVFAILILLSQIGVLEAFLKSNPEVYTKIATVFTYRNLIILVLLLIAGILSIIFFRKAFRQTRFYQFLANSFRNFIEGVKTIKKLESKWKYIGHTVFIYFMWLIALYIIFFSFKPTSHLSIFAGATAFVMGGLAMIAPVQAGIGPWHFMVYETLFIYGIEKIDGKIFALIAHTSSNGMLMIAGLIPLAILPVINRNKANPVNAEPEDKSQAILNHA